MPATAVIPEQSIEAEEGIILKIFCRVKGNPLPTVTWNRIGKGLPANAARQHQMIIIGRATLEDGGRYTCSAENYLQKSISTVMVTIHKKLSFFFKSSRWMQVYEHQNLTLSCIYEGGAHPIEVSWFKNNRRLLRGMSLTRNNQVLTLTQMERKDMGIYKCIVRSKFSVIESSTQVTVALIKTCKQLRSMGWMNSGIYTINPTGSRPVDVYCDMFSKNRVGVTVISHNSEGKTLVSGTVSYIKYITYNVTKDVIKAIVESSGKCEQFVKYECHSYGIGWYTGRGAAQCACDWVNTCARGVCHCRNNGPIRNTAQMQLQNKEFLPVSAVRFDQTVRHSTKYYTIGKLMCY